MHARFIRPLLAVASCLAACTNNSGLPPQVPDLGTACTPRAKDCVGDSVARLCPADGSGWVAIPCAPAQKCMNGDCVGPIAPAPRTRRTA
jgi:hypothetical protein